MIFLKKHKKQKLLFLFLVGLFSINNIYLIKADAVGNDYIRIKEPSVPKYEYTNDGQVIMNNNYTFEQSQVTIKIDGINYPRYLKFKTGGDGVYDDNDLLGLYSFQGVLYYGLNYSGRTLPVDADYKPSSPYYGYWGDVVYNTAYNSKYASSSKGAGYPYRGIDTVNNFKAGYQSANTGISVYPDTTPNLNGGSGKPSGNQFALKGSESPYSDKNDDKGKVGLRGDVSTEALESTNPSIPGSWRYMGYTKDGTPMTNSMFIDDSLLEENKKPWTWTYIHEPFNKGIGATDTEFNNDYKSQYGKGFVDYWQSEYKIDWLANVKTKNPKWNSEDAVRDYLMILSPKTDHIGGSYRGWKSSGGYRTFIIPVDNPLDLIISRMEIYDVNDINNKHDDKKIQTVTHTVNEFGVSVIIKEPEDVKMIPGKVYKVDASMTNRAAAHIVKNPTINSFLTYHKDRVSEVNLDTSYDQYKVKMNSVFIDGNGVTPKYYNKKGDPVDFIRKWGGDVPVLPSKNEMTEMAPAGSAPHNTVTDDFYYTIPTAKDYTELKSKFGADTPGQVRFRIDTQVNPKHVTSDDVYYQGFYTTAVTSDDINFDNNILSSIFNTQNMWMHKEYQLVDDATGKNVGFYEQGKKYTLKVKVENTSSKFNVLGDLKIDYNVMADGYELSGQKKTITVNKGDSEEVLAPGGYRVFSIPVTIPDNPLKEVEVVASINSMHTPNNNWFTKDDVMSVKLPVKLNNTINLFMDEKYNSGKGFVNVPSPLRIGESANIEVAVGSESIKAMNNVKVVLKEKIGNNEYVLDTEILGGLDNRKLRTVVFNIPASKMNKSRMNLIAEINPSGLGQISGEKSYVDNRIEFSTNVQTLDSILCKSTISLDESSARDKNEFTVSFMQLATVKRRDLIEYDVWYHDKDEYCQVDFETNAKFCPGHIKEKWSAWYSTEEELNRVSKDFYEEFKVTEILFRSKVTQDLKLGNDGWIDILDPANEDKVKAMSGYGFEMKVVTKYKTNFSKNNLPNANTSELKALDSANPYLQFDLSNVSVKYEPEDLGDVVIINPDGVCVKMPDGSTLTLNEGFDLTKTTGDKFNNTKTYEFSKKSSLAFNNTRKYYLNKDVSNGTYKIKLSTPKTGFGGSNALMDIEEFDIQVAGGFNDDLKDNLMQ